MSSFKWSSYNSKIASIYWNRPQISTSTRSGIIDRADYRFVPSQCESALLYNEVSHWLGASLESSLIDDWVVYKILISQINVFTLFTVFRKKQLNSLQSDDAYMSRDMGIIGLGHWLVWNWCQLITILTLKYVLMQFDWNSDIYIKENAFKNHVTKFNPYFPGVTELRYCWSE